MRRLLFVLFLFEVGYCQGIDIETAWQRILCYAPSIAAADAQVLSLEGEARQVSMMFNPVLEVESENLGVSNPSDDVEPPQTTFSLSQTLELGGKRTARFALASAVSCIAYWDAQIQREDARLELTTHFIEVRAAQEKLLLAKKREQIAENILKAVNIQVQNGKLSPLEAKKARVCTLTEKLAVREATSIFEQAKTHLSSMWGSSCPDFDCVDFELFECACLPCQTAFVEGFCQTPDYTKAKQVIASAAQNLSLQKANGIPDLTVMGGYRVFHDSNEGGWVVGVQIPLPLFNRNQGSVKSAACELNRAQFLLEEVMREGRERILLVYERLNASIFEMEMMQKELLTEAQQTLELTETGYQKGKFAYLDVLDAQKMLFEIQEKYIDVLSEYHVNRAELARLSGIKL